MHFLFVALTVGLLAACASSPKTPAAPTSGTARFPHPEEINVAPNDSLPRRAQSKEGAPHYPPRLLDGRVTATVVAAFVVDTAGRVEMRSVSFVEPAHDFEFHAAICSFLRQFQLVPLREAGVARRSLVFMPFVFWIGDDGPPPPNMNRYRRLADEMPREQLFAKLERRSHC